MKLALSGRPIATVIDPAVFAPLSQNEADALYVFSDAVIHGAAFRAHRLPLPRRPVGGRERH